MFNFIYALGVLTFATGLSIAFYRLSMMWLNGGYQSRTDLSDYD